MRETALGKGIPGVCMVEVGIWMNWKIGMGNESMKILVATGII